MEDYAKASLWMVTQAVYHRYVRVHDTPTDHVIYRLNQVQDPANKIDTTGLNPPDSTAKTIPNGSYLGINPIIECNHWIVPASTKAEAIGIIKEKLDPEDDVMLSAIQLPDLWYPIKGIPNV